VLAVITALLLVAVILSTGAAKLKWDVIAPGDARQLNELIKVETKDPAHPVDTYTPNGRVLYTTVAIEERVNGFEALWAKVHNEYKLVKEVQLTGNLPPETVQRINQEDMDQSKVSAEVVALRRLGYPVVEKGDGAAIRDVDKSAKIISGKLRSADVIVAIDGHPVRLRDDVGREMAGHKAGDRVTLTIRHGDGTTVPVVVEVHLSNPPEQRPLIGVTIFTSHFGYDLPFDVQIDTGPVGGPSAGLAFTLGLLDVLTPGELTGGKEVAVTGTIDTDEKVGQIGGVAQKTVAARRKHAVAFLVPVGEEKEARKHAGKMKIIAVKDLSDALRALASLGGQPLPAASAR
jgi:PDZ domain-containing protein